MTTLEKLRGEVDKIDDEIVSLLDKRLQVGKLIVDAKKDKNLPIEDLDREEEIISRMAGNSKIDEALLNELYYNIFDHIKNG
jgi:monofunctional chorismate mutase